MFLLFFSMLTYFLFAQITPQGYKWQHLNKSANCNKLNIYRKAPYLLYPGINTGMLILWQLNNTAYCQLEWGTDTTYTLGNISVNEYGTDHQYKTELTDLFSGTKYYYRVTCNGSSKTGSFFTGISNDTTSFSFYVYGDTRSNPQNHDLVAERIMASVNNTPNSQTFVISTGDLVANGNFETYWDEQFFSPEYTNIQHLLTHLPYIAAIGNHEGTGVLFSKYFPYPMYQDARYYYSYDYGNAHFTIVDQFTSYLPGSNQYTWLENDLASTNKTWKFIIMHMPGWSADGGHANDLNVQKYIQPLCKKYGVYFVFTGHNHYYSHAEVEDVKHITTGGGGAPLYTPNPNADSIVKVDKSYHFCKIDIKSDTMTYSAIRYDGSVIETFDFLNPILNGKENNKRLPDLNVVITIMNNSIAIKNKENELLSLKIFDVSGKYVDGSSLLKGTNIIKLQYNGIFFIRITDNKNRMVVKKIIKS